MAHGARPAKWCVREPLTATFLACTPSASCAAAGKRRRGKCEGDKGAGEGQRERRGSGAGGRRAGRTVEGTAARLSPPNCTPPSTCTVTLTAVTLTARLHTELVGR
jgi:hypothetical protein